MGGMLLIVTFTLAFLVDFGPTRGLRGMSNRLIGKISVAQINQLVINQTSFTQPGGHQNHRLLAIDSQWL